MRRVTSVAMILAGALLFTVAAGAAGDAKSKGWTPLFNGRNLDGWEKVRGSSGRGAGYHTGGTWTVENGILVGRRTPPDLGTSWLVTKQDYCDFILRLKFRPGRDYYNSGILIRDPAHAKLGRASLNGFEIKLTPGHKGQHSSGTIFYTANAYPQPLHAGEWADFEIHAIGDHLVTYMNGKKMAETHTRRSYCGGIGLHLHGGEMPEDSAWKDIEIQELPPAPRPFQMAEEKMELAPGDFAPLVSSADTDFTRAGDPNTTWSLEKDTLRASGGSQESWLLTKKSYENFVLTFDFKLNGAGSGGVGFRIPADASGNFADRGYMLAINEDDWVDPPGSIHQVARSFPKDYRQRKIFRPRRWNQARIYATGDHLITYLNSMKMAEIHIDRSSRGRIGFRAGPHSTVEYRNITIKPVAP